MVAAGSLAGIPKGSCLFKRVNVQENGQQDVC